MSDNNKILVISNTPTHPPIAGNRASILAYVELLKNLGYDVSFLWIAPINLNKDEYKLTTSYWGSKLFVFRITIISRLKSAFLQYFRFNRTGYYYIDDLFPIGLKSFLTKLSELHNFNTVIVNYVYLSKAFEYLPNSNKVLFTHDVFTNKYQLTGSKWFSVTSDQEAKALNRADVILAIQDQEALFYKNLTSKKVITCYSNFPITYTPYVGNKTLLYLSGSNEYNVESITWFIESVIDILLKTHSDLELLIGGSICKVLKDHINHPAIKFYGNVENLRDFYLLGDVVINPTFNGTGLKIKTFEAMSYGKVLISHPHSKIGILNSDNAPILSAATPEEYLEKVDYVFRDKDTIEKFKTDSTIYIEELNKVVINAFKEALNY